MTDPQTPDPAVEAVKRALRYDIDSWHAQSIARVAEVAVAAGRPIIEQPLREAHQNMLAQRDALVTEIDEWQNWSNGIADTMPPEYDGDEGQEDLIERWINDLRTERDALATTVAEIRALIRKVGISGWHEDVTALLDLLGGAE